MNKFLHFVRQASLCLLGAALLLAASQAQAQTMPDFSSGTTENWYYVVFSNGDVCLKDNGNTKHLETSYVVPGSSNLLWKLEGKSNDFTLRSQLGNYANFGNGNFMTTTTASSDACHFSLKKATHPDFDNSWEVAWNAKDGDAKYINENGGTTPGRYIICYTAGQVNNAIYFIPKSQLPETPVTAPNLKEYNISSSDSYLPEHRHTLWYINHP